jgi:hypothetical protein
MLPASHFQGCSRTEHVPMSALCLTMGYGTQTSPADYLRDVLFLTRLLDLVVDVFQSPYGNACAEDGSAPICGPGPVQFSGKTTRRHFAFARAFGTRHL